MDKSKSQMAMTPSSLNPEMVQKEVYEAPSFEVVEMEYEGVIADSFRHIPGAPQPWP